MRSAWETQTQSVTAICFEGWRGGLIPFPIISSGQSILCGVVDLQWHLTFSREYSSAHVDIFMLKHPTYQNSLPLWGQMLHDAHLGRKLTYDTS